MSAETVFEEIKNLAPRERSRLFDLLDTWDFDPVPLTGEKAAEARRIESETTRWHTHEELLEHIRNLKD